MLVSVRSGAPVSMPGMMDTILNLGLNDESVESLAKASNDRRFAFDSYRRFIQMYGNVVHGVSGELFEEVLTHVKQRLGVTFDNEIPAAELESVVGEFKKIFAAKAGFPFPSNPEDQLKNAILAVFKSWGNPRAVTYRKLHDIPDTLGTAVNIVSMVYGNLGDDCGTGVCFTRNPSDGTKELYGEFLINARKRRRHPHPLPIAELKDKMPDIYKQLFKITTDLETSYKDMQDIEFTIERQAVHAPDRSGKRSAGAAVKIAIDMLDEGLIDKKTAVSGHPGRSRCYCTAVDPKAEVEQLAKDSRPPPEREWG